MEKIDKPKELDKNTPLAIHLAVEFTRGLGDAVRDYPIASGFIALMQLFAAGVEVSQTLQGNPPSLGEVELNHAFMLIFGLPAGMMLEGGVRLVRVWARVEKLWKEGKISSDPSDPSFAEIFWRNYPEE